MFWWIPIAIKRIARPPQPTRTITTGGGGGGGFRLTNSAPTTVNIYGLIVFLNSRRTCGVELDHWPPQESGRMKFGIDNGAIIHTGSYTRDGASKTAEFWGFDLGGHGCFVLDGLAMNIKKGLGPGRRFERKEDWDESRKGKKRGFKAVDWKFA